MFRLRKAGCNGHVSVHGYYDILRCRSRSYRFERKRGKHRTLVSRDKMFCRGKRVTSQTKQVVCNVYSYFEKQAKKGGVTIGPLSRTVKATGLSRATVMRIRREKSRTQEGEVFVTPTKRYRRSRRRVVSDNFDREAIRRRIYHLYEQKVNVTLSRLLVVLESAGLFRGKRTSLHRLMKEMGFGYKRVNKRHYYEQPRIVEQRHAYLQRMRRNRIEKRPVVYLDETWCNAHHGKEMAWVEKDEVTGGTLGRVKKPSGKGTRLIVLHAGTDNGWIAGAALVFQSKHDTGDYHHEMNHQTFEEWFAGALLPNILPNSLIVMDNASYHSRRKEPHPTKSWTKMKMMEWLTSKGIVYSEQFLKSQIWEIVYRIVESNRPQNPIYVIDELASQAGHEVARLPVVHCELNPIEMAWAQVKGLVTPERWKKIISHVQQKIEDHYWEHDGLYDTMAEKFIIHVGDSSDGSSSDSDDSSSEED